MGYRCLSVYINMIIAVIIIILTVVTWSRDTCVFVLLKNDGFQSGERLSTVGRSAISLTEIINPTQKLFMFQSFNN